MLKKNGFWSNFVLIIEALSILLCVYMVLYSKYTSSIATNELESFLLIMPWLVLFYIFINNVFDTNIYFNQTKTNIILNSFLVQVIFTIVLTLICIVYVENFFLNFHVILLYLLMGSVIAVSIHLGIFYFFTRIAKPSRVLVLGKENAVYNVLKTFDNNAQQLHLVTHLVIGNYFENLKKVEEEIDIVYIAGILDPITLQGLYNYLIRKEKTIYLTSTIENSISINSHLLNISDESIIQVSPYYLSREQAAVKRLMDIVISFVLLILLTPIMLLTILAIKLESKGPIFYRQERVTLGNSEFSILKFRSMVVDAEAKTGPVLAQKDDSRVTKVGKFIRATRIDEIPQLINVLLGEMSIIGPRPERPNFVQEFTEINPFYPLRHNVRAGITGYAQVYGKYTSNFEKKLKFDLLYIKNYSLFLDIKLLLKTILIVFDKMSSQGHTNHGGIEDKNGELAEIKVLK
ncbi:TPA: sugar transferase [Streptococcus suis]|nr:sugar transferase [Streptococcus suis]HEM6082886.1 sugar transferase [Streptococcus suis]HEM6220445.1 sugar transferase [Streptococcus suis]HEM6303063.1 sugar transferase [Streptococcus suis]